jgi:TPR repeat protein
MHLEQFNSGAGVPTLNQNHLQGMRILIHEREKQEKVANFLYLYELAIEKNNKRREEEQRKYLAEQKRLAEEQKRLAEERKFVNRWKKFWGNVWKALCGFFDEIADFIIDDLLLVLIFAILMLPIIGSICAGCSVYCSKSGDKYFYGQEGVQQNYVQAVQEYKQIFPFITFNSKRTTNSTYNLATCYEYGLGTNKDSIQAFDRYLKAAKKGHIMAMNKVAQCYAIGYGTIQSTEESSKWFEKSLRKGSAEELLEVGWQYEIGNRLIQDYAQAMKCYTAAAKKGFAAAQMKVGDCYMIGTCGVQKNTAEAANWYQMAANQGDGEATEILQLLSNKPTSRDINRWYQTGDKYYHGNNGVKIDYAEAIKWYRKAALMGHADAQNDFGFCYDNGRGLNEDDVEAVKWYRKAAEQGIADAQNNLGNRLYNGQGIIKNYAEAAKWYRKSAENGNQNAQYNLGWCYQYGQGVTKNLTEAKKWYQKAADKGYESAKKKLVELNQ